MESYEWPQPPAESAFPVAKPGWPLIFGAAFATLVLALLDLTPAALLGLAGTFFLAAFFRDPDRTVPMAANLVVSPADGRVVTAETVAETDYLDGPCLKISVFMTVFNVHVNRIPHEGTVRRVAYHPGKFLSAHLDKASRENEHNAVFVETPDGRKLCVVQVAGLVARRILCGAREGDVVSRGQRFGMICLGSRLDIYLPPDTTPAVAVGDRVRAGTSVIGTLS
jgi:phosphatidylserine decarboxylase